ncbi:MAG: carbon storage regulator [Gammaproteobacteria bacterium]|nr:carbon storage regulator [Gammaproteobacteria bacterium]
MLILKRQSGESIQINDDIKITIYFSRGNQIKIGIDAPRHVSVIREELLSDRQTEDAAAIDTESKQNRCEEKQVSIKTKRQKRIIFPAT